MELAASLPRRAEGARRREEVVLRDALRGWVPDEILDAPKQGFGVPLGDWLRGELRDFSREVLLDRATLERGYFAPDDVRGLLDRHAAGARTTRSGIWALLMLELWHREFVDASPRAPVAMEAATRGR